MSGSGGLDQGVFITRDHKINVGTMIEQQCDNGQMVRRRRGDQRIAVTFDADIRIGAAVEQQTDDLDATRLRRDDQRCVPIYAKIRIRAAMQQEGHGRGPPIFHGADEWTPVAGD